MFFWGLEWYLKATDFLKHINQILKKSFKKKTKSLNPPNQNQNPNTWNQILKNPPTKYLLEVLPLKRKTKSFKKGSKQKTKQKTSNQPEISICLVAI